MRSRRADDEATVGCGGCGARRFTRTWRSRDYVTGEAFDVLRCSACGLRQTHPVPSPEAMGHYYPDAYYGRRGRRFVGPLENLEKSVRESRSRFIRRMHPAAGTVLDVGCGRGTMLSELSAAGWTCFGTELAAGQEGAKTRPGVTVLYRDLPACGFADGQFDVVTLWHVLEHLRAPFEAIDEVHRILAPGGLLVIEVPNASSWQAAIGRGRWLHLDVPRHLFHFDPPWLEGRLSNAGFEMIGTGTLSLEQGPFGLVQTLLNRVTIRSNWLYAKLKRIPKQRGGRFGFLPDLWDGLLTAALILPVALFGTAAELAASAFGRGGVVRLVARKRPAHTA